MTMKKIPYDDLTRQGKQERLMEIMADANSHCSDSSGSPRTVIIEHFLSKNRLQVELIPVDESDCAWRFPDGAELDHSWDVVAENAEVLAGEALPATSCSACGKNHWLTDDDAGSDREIARLCTSCFKQNT